MDLHLFLSVSGWWLSDDSWARDCSSHRKWPVLPSAIAMNLSWGLPCRLSWPRNSLFPVVTFSTLSLLFFQPDHSCSLLYSSSPNSWNFYFLFPRISGWPAMNPPCYLDSLDLWILVQLSFTIANIHLWVTAYYGCLSWFGLPHSGRFFFSSPIHLPCF